MEGTELTKQEKESKLADEFDIFTLEKGEMIHSYSIRFVIGVKQLKELHNISFGQLYAHPKQNEPDANEVRTMKARFPYPLALIANTYNPPPSYSSYKSQYNPPMSVTGNNGVVKTVGELNAIPPKSSASEELVFTTNTDVDFLNDSNVNSDNPYLDNNENEVVQEMTSFAQNDVAIFSLIENLQHVFTRCNMINLESKQVNEQLTIELDRYRKQIKVLET
ncbi:hypothetical protein Tco_1292929 [Tanacetum coccineum]